MADATSETPRPTTSNRITNNNNESSNSESNIGTTINLDPELSRQDASLLSSRSQDPSTSREGDALIVNDARTTSAKRKRTSPEDQAILEAEYKANPKPDKAARLEIVKKVSLGEKAVQIWFQNRRQNTRRKSRPLLPHEIAAFGLGGMAALSSDPAATYGAATSPSFYGSSSQPELAKSQENGNVEYQHLKATSFERPSSSAPVAIMTTPQKDNVDPQDLERVGLPSFSTSFPEPASHEFSKPSTDGSSSQPILPLPVTTPGYLANRRSASSSYFATPSTASNHPPFITPNSRPFTSMHPNSAPNGLLTPLGQSPNSASQVRLSYSSDGKASLVSSVNVISPPRASATRPGLPITPVPFPARRLSSLQRSHSAVPFSTPLPRTDNPLSSSQPITSSATTPQTNIPPPRFFSGRSKDARAWEFCCDSEARDELTQQAENESHGSAIAAISLLRSTSGSALKVNQNKRNAPISSMYRIDKDNHYKRPKIARSQSLLARMQGPHRASTKGQIGQSAASITERRRSREGIESSNDSDKENWTPLEGGGNRRMHTPGLSNYSSDHDSRKRVLGESTTNSPTKDNTGRRKDNKVAPKELTPDVASFMGGPVSPSKKGDLDCIQGLLSLSQGNWQ